MRDLADRTKALLEKWKLYGVCMTCFADLDGKVTGSRHPHLEWCTSEVREDISKAATGVPE